MHRRKAVWILLLMVILGSAALLGLVFRSPADLRDISTKVLDVQKFSTELGPPMSGCYWLSDSKIVAHENVGDGAFSTAYFLDTTSGIRTDIPGLTKLVADRKGLEWKLSPDNKWLLWRSVREEEGDVYTAMTLEGQPVYSWKTQRGEGDMDWLADGRSFVRLVDKDTNRVRGRKQGLQVCRLGSPKPVRTVDLVSAGDLLDLIGCAPDGRVLLAESTYLADDDPNLVSSSLSLLSVALDGSPPAVRKYTVTLPDRCKDNQVALSPDGRQLAWTVEMSPRTNLPVLERWLNRLLRRPAEQSAVAIFVSHTDGSGFREVGRVPHTVEQNNYSPISIHLNGWLPGNKRLSFLLNDRRTEVNHTWLYTVPVSE